MDLFSEPELGVSSAFAHVLDLRNARSRVYYSNSAPELLHVKDLTEPTFETDLFDKLVMEDSQKKRLLALVKSYSRVDNSGAIMKQPAWTADFVKGKGQGLIFLLHGSPGVGKTCTAGTHTL
jgi:hypothetical protein